MTQFLRALTPASRSMPRLSFSPASTRYPEAEAVQNTITHLSDRILVGQLNLRGFLSRHVLTRHGRVHVLDAKGRGALPPLLVLHGFSAAAHYYDGVMLRMRPYVRRIVAPDLLGHGLSEMPREGLSEEMLRDALLHAIDHVLDEPAIVFGNSMGGAAALKLALLRPEKVKGLFLVAPGGAFMTQAEIQELISRFHLDTHDQALAFVDRLFAKPHPMRQVLAWGTRGQFDRPGLRNILEQMTPAQLLTPEEMGAIRAPTQLIWGAADRVLDPSCLEFYRRYLPAHARVQVVDHYGHVPHMDYPEELHHRLLAFAKDVASGRARSAVRPNLSAISASVAP